MNRIGIIKNTAWVNNSGVTTKYAGKTGALTTQIAGLSEVNLLANGSIALFQQNGALIDVVTPVFTNSPDYIILAVGTNRGYRTSFIPKGAKVTRQEQLDPVSKVMGIGKYQSGASPSFGISESSIVVGDEFIIKVTNPDLPFYDDINNVEFVSVIVDNKTMALAATKLEAVLTVMETKLNTMKKFDFTAVKYYSAGNGGIKITSNVAGSDFNIKLIEKWAYTTVTTVTANVTGFGNYAQVLADERANTQEDGHTNIFGNPEFAVGALISDVVDGTYNTLNIEHRRVSTHVPNAKSFDDSVTFRLAFLEEAIGASTNDGTLWTKVGDTIKAYV